MSEAIAQTLAEFKQFVSGIEFDPNDFELDKQLGQANVLLSACRGEIDKVWATARNQIAKGIKMPKTEAGNQLLLSLGMVKKVEVERRF